MDWQTILLSVISIVVTALVTWLSERLITWINTKISNIKSAKLFTDAVEVITRAVKTTYQTYVSSLKDKNMFTKDAQAQALEQAREMALKQLSQDTQDYIAKNFGDVKTWINSMIESIIYDLKNKFVKGDDSTDESN